MKNALIRFLLYAGIIAAANFIAYHLIHIPTRTQFMGALVLLAAWPIFQRPVIGMYILVIGMPFVGHIRRLYYLVYARPTNDPLLVFEESFLVLMLAALFFHFKNYWQKGTGYRLCLGLMLFYAGYMLFRVFAFNISSVSVSIMKFKFYGPPVFFFFIGMVYAYHHIHLKWLWRLTVIIGALAVAYGMKQLYIGYSEAENIWLSTIDFSTLFVEDIIRPFSFFKAPVVLADYAQLSLIGSCILWTTATRKNIRALLLLCFPLMAYGILITSVRSNWIGLIGSMLLWIFIVNMKNLPRKILIICLIALLYAGYNVIMGFTAGDSAGGLLGDPVLSQQVLNQAHINSLVAQRSSAILNPFQEHSFLSRLELWHQMLRFSVTPVNAILGRGLGTLKTDSLYFTYLAEFGYPGAFGIIAIFAAFIYYGLKLPHLLTPSFSRSLIKGIAVMNIVFFVISITGTHIHYFPGTFYFWFFNGVLMRYALDQRTGALPYGVELSDNSRENG